MTVERSGDVTGPGHVAVLTPPGRGAIATVSAWGNLVANVVTRHFRGLRTFDLSNAAPDQHRYGRWIADGYCEDVVLGVIRSDQIEIHCHGGEVPCRAIADCFVAYGFREVPWQQALSIGRHAAGEGQEAIAIEAQTDLALATTEAAAWILLDQEQGALAREAGRLSGLVDKGDWNQAATLTQRLLGWSELGAHLIEPWQVVLAGPANAGKSSLMNCLLGYTRSIVYDQPGTTRDVLVANSAVNGWPVEFRDTAGQRLTVDATEQAGIARAQSAAQDADLLIWLFDLSAPPDHWGQCPRHRQRLRVGNKLDLVADDQRLDHEHMDAAISVTHETGVAELLQMIAEHLVPDCPEPGEAVPFRQRHLKCLSRVAHAVEQQNAADAMAALDQLLSGTSL